MQKADWMQGLQKKMFQLIADWETSGMAQGLFCSERELTLGRFAYWRGKYLRHQTGGGEVNKFTAITPGVGPDIRDTPCEIVYPSGVRVVLPQADVELIRALAR